MRFAGFLSLALLAVAAGARALDAPDAGTPDESVAHLSSLTRLKELWPSNQLSDHGLAFVGKLTALESLHFDSAQSVTDNGLASLSGLKRRRCLYLYSPRVTDAD